MILLLHLHHMSKLPSFKAREILEILFRSGFEKVRTSGSHIRLRKSNRFVTVPFHSRGNIPIETLRSIIRQAGFSVEEFIKLLKNK